MSISKTRLLSSSEASSLRGWVKACFAQRHPERKPVEPKTYLGAYEELRDDILAIVPEANSSISLNRLRKLFYYTDPEACTPEKMEAPSFGKDFLEALEQYADCQKEKENLPVRRLTGAKKKLGIGLLILLLTAVCSWMVFSFYFTTGEPWREDFNDVSLEGLQSRGWEALDCDPTYFIRQTQPGMLTVYTLPGDFWVKPNEERKITNLIVKPIGPRNVVITCKIVGFYPNQPHQQIAILLLKEKNIRVPHLRVGYGFGTSSGQNTKEGQRILLGTLELAAVQINVHEEVFTGLSVDKKLYADENMSAYPDTIFLRVEIEGRKCRLFRKYNYEWNVFDRFKEVELSFAPALVGIGAFQGWTNDDGTPMGAEVIPGYIDWLEVRPLDGDGVRPLPGSQ